jgi:predicted RNase H-like HicB family nuclease
MNIKFTYWKEADQRHLGYLNQYPDHWTQGETLDDLKAHLRDLHETFGAEEIPRIRREGELEAA